MSKKFTDLYVRRPVLATVISLLILLLGLKAIYSLPVRQYPEMDNTVITVTTSYPGASAQVVQGFITTPIENSIASAEGIDYLTATSVEGQSTITANIKLNYDPNTAFTDIMSKVSAVTNQLPKAAEQPVLEKSTGSQFALMYMSFTSKQMSAEQITDYLTRVVQPKLETLGGVAQAQILGGKVFAMRIWLNPKKMAAFNVTAADVQNALTQNNFQAAAGSTKGMYVAYDINAATDLDSAKGFENMVIRQKNGAIVRMRDIAKVQLGSEDYSSSVTFNGQKGVFIGIQGTPTANPLTVINEVRAKLPQLFKEFPSTLHGKIVYDSTLFIRASIKEVVETIFEATLIVILVIFLFLGSIRSVLIPVITIPLSLIGVCSIMLALGFSLNLLTLLAMVLAIGLVVDDAIVVVENIHRHIEEGKSPFKAALIGAREIATPVISMTITLAAVYAPIAFLGGVTGALFKEFAMTLAASVILSGVVALTLSPMMCSKFLNLAETKKPLVKLIDKTFNGFKTRYERALAGALNYRPVTLVMAVVVLLSCFFLYMNTQKQLAPTEDQGAIFVVANAPQYANLDYTEKFTHQFNDIFRSFKQTQDFFTINGMNGVNSAIAADILVPWDQRSVSQQTLQPQIQAKMNQVSGLQTVVFPLPSLPGTGGGLPIQFVLTTTGSYKNLYQLAEALLKKAQGSGLFEYVDNTLKINKPEVQLSIDRSKAGDMGINMEDIATVLATGLGGNYTNWFSMEGRSYKVIPQLLRSYRFTPDKLKHLYIKTSSGTLIPLSTIVKIKQTVEPNSLTQFQQLNSATIEGVMSPGVTMGTAVEYLQKQANAMLPKGTSYNYSGQTRQYMQEGSALVFTFFFALIVIFLVLAAQFESFRDPLIILIAVPMSICGALIPLNLGAATINIYTQVGLVTLIGLISKHGILMTEFANNIQRDEGLSIRDAIHKAAGIRLRAILMTTFSMILGVMPLVFASGAGAESRFDIGLVIASGMFIGTGFTLFVVPTMYTFLAKDHSKEDFDEDIDLDSNDDEGAEPA